jgi:site-specific DNA-methyltransferase (adenine-specific)
MAEAAGFRFWKPLVWDKVTIGLGYHYRARYELILFFEKGKRRLADLAVPDILRARRVRGGYPTEKPVTLLRTLVTQSSDVGDTVVDPFVGSGSTGTAALSEDRAFLGADITEAALAVARPRLAALGAEAPAVWLTGQQRLFDNYTFARESPNLASGRDFRLLRQPTSERNR